MVDDLDRCRPERIIEILEVIKLFLAVDRTTFIIAAGENVIKYSIREKYPPMNGFDVELDKEYIEKIIQLPIYIPRVICKGHTKLSIITGCTKLFGTGKF